MGIPVSCKYLPNEPTSVFYTAVNHSDQYRTFNNLPGPLVEAVGEISTSKSRVTNQRNDVKMQKCNAFSAGTTDPTKMAAIFQN